MLTGPHDTELKAQFPALDVAALCESLLKEVNEGVATLPSDEGTEVVVSEPLVPAALRALAHLSARSSDIAGTALGNTAFVQLLATLLGSTYDDTRQETATLVRKCVQRLGGVTAVTRSGTQTLTDLFPVLLSQLSSGLEAVVLDAAWTISLLLESDQLHGAFAEHSGVKKIFKVLTKLEQTMIYSQSDNLASTRGGSAVNIHNDVEAQTKRNNYYKSLQLSISWILLQLTTNSTSNCSCSRTDALTILSGILERQERRDAGQCNQGAVLARDARCCARSAAHLRASTAQSQHAQSYVATCVVCLS